MDESTARWILAAAASAGVVGVGVASAGATWELSKKPKPTWKEKIAGYIPAVTIGLLTIGCIISANVIGDEANATLSALLLMADEAYLKRKETSDKAVAEIAEERGLTVSDVTKDIFRRHRPPRVGREEELWYDGHLATLRGSDGYFGATELEMWIALYFTNRRMQLDGEVSLAYFYRKLHLKPPEGSEDIGWSIGAGVVYGYEFIDCVWEEVHYDDNLVCQLLTFPYPPTKDFMTYTPDEDVWQDWPAKKSSYIVKT